MTACFIQDFLELLQGDDVFADAIVAGAGLPDQVLDIALFELQLLGEEIFDHLFAQRTTTTSVQGPKPCLRSLPQHLAAQTKQVQKRAEHEPGHEGDHSHKLRTVIIVHALISEKKHGGKENHMW